MGGRISGVAAGAAQPVINAHVISRRKAQSVCIEANYVMGWSAFAAAVGFTKEASSRNFKTVKSGNGIFLAFELLQILPTKIIS
jgi:hypothetical protein